MRCYSLMSSSLGLPKPRGASVQVAARAPCSLLGLATAIAGQVCWDVLGNEELDKVQKTNK